MDAIGVAVFSIGGFLLYASIKGEHPWSLFVQTLGGAAPQTLPTGSAPESAANVAAGTAHQGIGGSTSSVFGPGAIHP